MRCDILDFSEYGNEADGRSDSLLKKALEQCGARATIIPLSRKVTSRLLAEWVWLRYDLRTPDDLLFVEGVAASLSQSGHLVFPPALSVRLCEDKWESYLALKAARVPTVETFPVSDSRVSAGPIVSKPRVGWGGAGMALLRPDALREGRACRVDSDYVCQPFVPHDHTWTALLLGAGDDNNVLLKKLAKPGDFRTNSTYGEKAERIDDIPEITVIARQALAAMRLPVGSVDLIEQGGSVAALEVNSAPCLWYDEIPDLDIAGVMACSVVKWFLRAEACE